MKKSGQDARQFLTSIVVRHILPDQQPTEILSESTSESSDNHSARQLGGVMGLSK